GALGLKRAAGFDAVDAGGVLDRGELLDAVGLVNDAAFAKGEGVKDESLQFDGVWFGGIDRRAGLRVHAGDSLLGSVVGQIEVVVGVDAFDEVDAQDVDGDGAGEKAEGAILDALAGQFGGKV